MEVPSAAVPQLKSIQLFFFLNKAVLLDIFTVGTGEAKGVPLPVVKSTMCVPVFQVRHEHHKRPWMYVIVIWFGLQSML